MPATHGADNTVGKTGFNQTIMKSWTVVKARKERQMWIALRTRSLDPGASEAPGALKKQL